MKNLFNSRLTRQTAAMGCLYLLTSPAFATVAVVPEPGVLGVLAAGAVAGGILYLRNRKK